MENNYTLKKKKKTYLFCLKMCIIYVSDGLYIPHVNVKFNI